MDIQTDSHAGQGRQIDRQTNGQTDRQIDRQEGRQVGRQAGRQAGKQAGRQGGRQAGRETDRQTSSKKDERYTHSCAVNHWTVYVEYCYCYVFYLTQNRQVMRPPANHSLTDNSASSFC